jgi:glycosyltransferase involved in cell wall biosynthesis
MGGVETHCQALYPRLVSKGHCVTLLARRGYVDSDAPYLYEGVKVVPLCAPRKKSLEAICHTAMGLVWVALRRRQFDILHVHGIGPALLVPVARLTGLAVVMTHHGPDYDRQKWGPFAKKVLRLGEKFGCRFSSAVIAVSRHIGGYLKELYGCNGQLIPNGVPIPELVSAGAVLSRYGLDSRKYILAMGRLVPEKGFHDLLSAYGELKTDWRLVIAGAADHEDDYSKGVKERADSDPRVVMTGFIKGKELGELLSCAGLFVLPSYHEGLPIALLEAMSYGIPVLTSDIPATRELVHGEETFPAGDITALRAKLSAFLDGRWRGSNGRNKVAAEYDWDMIADATEDLYLKTVKKRVA